MHYPTDISLLWDAMRKVIELTGKSCESENLSDWRQHRFNLKQLKKRYRKAQKIKHSTSKDEAKKAARSEAVHQSYRNYLLEAERQIDQIDRRVLKGETILHSEKVFYPLGAHVYF